MPQAAWAEYARSVVAGDREVALATIAHAARVAARMRGLDPDGARVLLGPTGPAPASPPDAPLAPEELGPLLEACRTDPAWRKRAGSYFTSPALVEPTVARALRPLLANGPASVCDPACGGGAFLIAAHRELVGAGADAETALAHVAGVDADGDAVRVARAALWLESGLDPERVAPRVVHDDALLGTRWRCALAATFDAVIGNPPWDIHKPDSRRFFARFDADFARLSKQDASRAQHRLLDDPRIAELWASELAAHRAFSRRIRGPGSPFTHQGRGDANRYKLFTELAWRLLRPGGRLGLLLPSGFYSDAGSAPLRRLLIDEARWEWLFGFENRRGLFPIDSRYKFAAVVAEKGGRTRSIRTAFLQVDPDAWREPDAHALALPVAAIRAASPRSLAVPELRDRRDAEILERIAAASHPLGDELDRDLRYRRELDQTVDAERFAALPEWEARGYRRDARGDWRDGDDRVALPVWEGRMIGAYDFSEKGWVRGRGRRAVWRVLPFEAKTIEPQFLIDAGELARVDPNAERPKLGFMAIASATNARSMVAASLIDAPCGNSVPTLRGPSVADDLVVLAVLNSLVYDFALRTRLGGTNLNRFVLAETPMLRPELRTELSDLAPDVAALCWIHPRFDRAWRQLGTAPRTAVAAEDRLELRARLDAAVARAFGLDADDFAWIVRGCTHPTEALRKPSFTRGLDPKGLWRVDRGRAPEDRLPVRALACLRAPTVSTGRNCLRSARASLR